MVFASYDTYAYLTLVWPHTTYAHVTPTIKSPFLLASFVIYR